ncbi:MAG: HD domain-containing protein [Alphaproteobacteria bacterium]|nr:HD domain-containing protein [Alphaproteobacteria bacterium]
MLISVSKAQNFIEELKQNELALGRDPKTWFTYENHVYGTAQIAKMIASEISTMNADRVYVMGLLHDICRTEEDRVQRFHGILGYEKLINQDKDVARICLVHMFPWSNLPPYEQCTNLFYGKEKDYQFIANFIKNNKPVDEDYLIQLCDNLANKNGLVTLEQRAAEFIERHGNVNVDDILIDSNEIKKYFDKKIGHDIYDFFKSR